MVIGFLHGKSYFSFSLITLEHYYLGIYWTNASNLDEEIKQCGIISKENNKKMYNSIVRSILANVSGVWWLKQSKPLKD